MTRRDQAEELPVGWVEVTTAPAASTATHNDGIAHDTALICLPKRTERQAPRPVAGLVLDQTSPMSSPARQSAGEAHEMLVSATRFRLGVSFQAPAPAVGSVLVK